MPSVLRLTAILFLASSVWSQQPSDTKKPPADPCASAQSQMEITECWGKLANKAESDLTALYQKILKAVQARIAAEDTQLKGYEERALAKLKIAQVAWTHYRDAQCDAAGQQYEGGTIEPSVESGCHKELADQRMKELHDTYAIYLKSK